VIDFKRQPILRGQFANPRTHQTVEYRAALGSRVLQRLCPSALQAFGWGGARHRNVQLSPKRCSDRSRTDQAALATLDLPRTMDSCCWLLRGMACH
jgi:hypothetical protein